MRADVVERPIDPAALLREVASDASGATSLFVGTVRDVNEERAVTGIDYSAYAAMAVGELRAIAAEAAERYATPHVVVEHRLGTLTLGEASVAIAVSHARRAPAMAATRYVIEEIKRRVPIWKREHYADGTREWVDPTGTGREAASAGGPPHREGSTTAAPAGTETSHAPPRAPHTDSVGADR
ncbi:MAG: molybdenum cofactor biosynthesis protein MoaE [Gemmatimonadaceae bacterium]